MQLTDFMAHLRLHSALTVMVNFPSGAIDPNFHLTEVLRTEVYGVDCGGHTSRSTQTVLQLVESSPGAAARELSAAKMLAILERSHSIVQLAPDSEVLIEFTPDGAYAAQRFQVAAVQAFPGVLEFSTAGSRTQCKAAERSGTVCGVPSQAGCCVPALRSGERLHVPVAAGALQ